MRRKPLKIYEIVQRANVANDKACQFLLWTRGAGLVISIFTWARACRMMHEIAARGAT